MKRHIERLGAVPFLFLGVGLFLLGLLAVNHIVNNYWPFDVARLDLVRAAPEGIADAPAMLEAANLQIVFAFLTSVMVSVTGSVLPIVYYLNRRFQKQRNPHFLVITRQAMWVGLWLAFCVWLQMNRTFGLAVALLVAAVLIMFELLLQVRTRAATALQ